MKQSTHHPGLMVDDGGFEPSTIIKDWATFTVHYLHATQKEDTNSPEWFAFTLVVFDEQKRVYPAECFDIPENQQPPGIDGVGNTHIEAYEDLKRKLNEFEIGMNFGIIEQ